MRELYNTLIKYRWLILLTVCFVITAGLGEYGYISLRLFATIWLGVPGLLITIGNDYYLWRGTVKKERTPSVAPFLGGGMVAVCILLWFGRKYWAWALLPLMLDYGCLPLVLLGLYEIIPYLCHSALSRNTEKQAKRSDANGTDSDSAQS
ncbi:hypothetical protein IJT17_06925 [bacterium]|nr:hypothetical protein [bacterium]